MDTGSNSLDPDQTPSLVKIVSMIRKYHNHKPKTSRWHREEEPYNHHESPIFDSWGTGKQAYLFQGNKGMVIPLGGSHKRSNFQTIHQFICLFTCLSTCHIKLCLWGTDSCEIKTCILIVLCILFKHTLLFVIQYRDQHHICSRVCSRDIWSVIVVLGILLKHALCPGTMP